MKKKTLAVLLAAALDAPMPWGCGKEGDAGASAPPTSTTAESTDSSTAPGTDSGTQPPDLTGYTPMVYRDAGMTKSFQEITGVFRSYTGCEMNVTYASAGQVQSQATTSEEGDLFIAGSGGGLKSIEPYVEGKKGLVKCMPVLAVQSSDPKNIMGLANSTGGGVALVVGGMDSAPIGKITKKAMTDAGILDQVQIETTTATASQMPTVPAAKEADAAIVREESCDAQNVEIVNTTDLDPYIKTIPAIFLSCAVDKDALRAFNQYLDMDIAKEI